MKSVACEETTEGFQKIWKITGHAQKVAATPSFKDTPPPLFHPEWPEVLFFLSTGKI